MSSVILIASKGQIGRSKSCDKLGFFTWNASNTTVMRSVICASQYNWPTFKIEKELKAIDFSFVTENTPAFMASYKGFTR